MSRRKHPTKEIEEALEYAELRGWRVVCGGSHAWGKMYCPFNDSQCRCAEFCVSSIWSTPRNAFNHARQIERIVNHCVHSGREES